MRGCVCWTHAMTQKPYDNNNVAEESSDRPAVALNFRLLWVYVESSQLGQSWRRGFVQLANGVLRISWLKLHDISHFTCCPLLLICQNCITFFLISFPCILQPNRFWNDFPATYVPSFSEYKSHLSTSRKTHPKDGKKVRLINTILDIVSSIVFVSYTITAVSSSKSRQYPDTQAKEMVHTHTRVMLLHQVWRLFDRPGFNDLPSAWRLSPTAAC